MAGRRSVQFPIEKPDIFEIVKFKHLPINMIILIFLTDLHSKLYSFQSLLYDCVQNMPKVLQNYNFFVFSPILLTVCFHLKGNLTENYRPMPLVFLQEVN